LQQAHHDQAGDQKAGVADAREGLDVIFQHMTKDQQVEHRGEHGRGHGLEADLPEAKHLFDEQRAGALE